MLYISQCTKIIKGYQTDSFQILSLATSSLSVQFSNDEQSFLWGGAGACQGVEVIAQLSVLSTVYVQGWSSTHQTQCQVPFATQPSHCLRVLLDVNCIYDREGPNIALTFREVSNQMEGRHKSYWLFIEQVIATQTCIKI